MKKRLLCLLLCLTVVFSAVGCTETPETNSQSSVVADDTHPNDFYTQNGQGVLPTEVKLPALAKSTDTDHLYSLPISFPAGSSDCSFHMTSSAIHMEYTVDGNRYFGAISYESGAILSTQKIPYRGNAGSLADGRYWIANCDGLVVTFYTPDGTATEVLSNNNSYKGSMRPNFITVSADGKSVIAGFETGTPFILIDIATKEKIRITTKEGSSESWTYIAEADGRLLFSGSRGNLLEVNPADKSFAQTDGSLRYSDAFGGLYRVADLRSGLLLKGTSDGKNALMLLTFIEPEEVLWDVKFGMGVTACDCNLSVYNLRTKHRTVKFTLGRTHNSLQAQLCDDGLLFVSAMKGGSYVCYLYDLVSASKSPAEEPGLQEELSVTDSLDDLIDACADKVAQKYGIEILCGSEGNDFPTEDYVAKAETDPGTVFSALQEVDLVLSHYPEGMLSEAIGAYSGLQLYLCGSLYGVDEAAQNRVGGLTTDYGGYIVVIVDIYNGIDSTLPHELSHVFDRHISSCSTMYFDWMEVWESVTPYDDAYLNTYEGYEYATKYTVGYESNYNNIWFTDCYGRSYPTEDRARLMECMFDSETGYMKDLLVYDNLSYKARLYSFILRQCFESCQVEEELYWERFTGIPHENEFADLTKQKAA